MDNLDQLVRDLDRFKARGEWDEYLLTWKAINDLANAAEPQKKKLSL